MNFIKDLFNENFMPHGHCYLWKPEIVWMNVVGDSIIIVAYYSIPIILTYLVYKSKGRIPFNTLFVLFSIFILACGTTHLMEIINIWKSHYVLAGIIKVITAISSILTALALLPAIPKILEVLNESHGRARSK